MSADPSSCSISLGNLSLQPCIDILTKAVMNDSKQLAKFTSATSLIQQVQTLLCTYSHKPQVTIREAVFEIVKELSLYGDAEEGKSEALAEKCKLLGSKAFSQHEDSEALRLYSKALQLSPATSSNTALLYANRSAVLYHMARYQECLLDIERAKQHKYPQHLRHKVLVRKAQCLQQLGRLVEARAIVKEAKDATNALEGAKLRTTYLATLDEVCKALIQIGVDEAVQDLGNKSNDGQLKTPKSAAHVPNENVSAAGVGSLISETSEGEDILQPSHEDLTKELEEELHDFQREAINHNLLDGPNETINFMSAALELRETTTQGRHIISKRFIPRGSTVIVERPFASILLPQHLTNYCYSCISYLSSVPVPCHSCRVVLFCSNRCRDASAYWHRLDCCRLMLTSAGGMAQLALRAMMVAGWRTCKAVMEEDPTATSKEEQRQYNRCSRVGRYRALYRLVHHIDRTPVEEQIQYCLAAIILATALQNKLKTLGNSQHNNTPSKSSFRNCMPQYSSSASTSSSDSPIETPGLHCSNTVQSTSPTNIALSASDDTNVDAICSKAEGQATKSCTKTSCEPTEGPASNSWLPEGWGSLEEVAALLYRHIGQLVCNGYAIYQVLPQEHARDAADDAPTTSSIESLSQERLASAIYATASLMNHSCQPTTINSYIGSLLVIRTIVDVQPGDQVYSCYGPHFCRQSRGERQELLRQQYRFSCYCKPCTDEHFLRQERRWWGLKCESCGGVAAYTGGIGDVIPATAEGRPSITEAGQTGQPNGVEAELLSCYDCGAIDPPSPRFRELCGKAQELHAAGVSCVKSEPGNLLQAVQDLEEATKAGEIVYCLDNQFLASIHDARAMGLAAYGSYGESARVLLKYLKMVERRYGVTSVEVGHELVKYVRILQHQKAALDCASANTSVTKELLLYSREIAKAESRINSIFTADQCQGLLAPGLRRLDKWVRLHWSSRRESICLPK